MIWSHSWFKHTLLCWLTATLFFVSPRAPVLRETERQIKPQDHDERRVSRLPVWSAQQRSKREMFAGIQCVRVSVSVEWKQFLKQTCIIEPGEKIVYTPTSCKENL